MSDAIWQRTISWVSKTVQKGAALIPARESDAGIGGWSDPWFIIGAILVAPVVIAAALICFCIGLVVRSIALVKGVLE